MWEVLPTSIRHKQKHKAEIQDKREEKKRRQRYVCCELLIVYGVCCLFQIHSGNFLHYQSLACWLCDTPSVYFLEMVMQYKDRSAHCKLIYTLFFLHTT